MALKFKGKGLREEIMKIIERDWPIHVSGICVKIHIKPSISNVSKVKYHVDILRKQHRVNTKRIDRALVAWPCSIEKLRVVQEFFKDVP